MQSLHAVITIRNYSTNKPLRIQIAIDTDKDRAMVPGIRDDGEARIPADFIARDITIAPGKTYEHYTQPSKSYFVSVANYAESRNSQITVQVKDDTELNIEDLGHNALAIIREIEIVNKTPNTTLVDLAISNDEYGFVPTPWQRQDDEEPFVYQRINGVRKMFHRKLGLFPAGKKASTDCDSEYVNEIIHYTSYPISLRFISGYLPHNCILKARLVDSTDTTIHDIDTWTGQDLFPLTGNKTLLEVSEPAKGSEITDVEFLKTMYARLGYIEKAKNPPLKTVAPYLAVKHVVGTLPAWRTIGSN